VDSGQPQQIRESSKQASLFAQLININTI